MKQLYTIAHNTISIDLPPSLPAWDTIEPRFKPFEETSPVAQPLLDIVVSSQPVPALEAKEIYEPQHAGVGFITSRVLQLPGAALVMEFKHISEPLPRLRLTLSPGNDTAVIAFDPVGDETDHYFLTHAIMIAYFIATSHNGTLMIHSSAIEYNGRAYLFQGRSGTGKSTHSRMWLQNIPGARLLNDDNPLIRISPDGVPMAYGSPWSGKTHCYRNASLPVGAFVRIVRASDNHLVRLSPLRAYASLTASVFNMPFLDDTPREVRHKTIETLATLVPCCEMHCLPNPQAAFTCLNNLPQPL